MYKQVNWRLEIQARLGSFAHTGFTVSAIFADKEDAEQAEKNLLKAVAAFNEEKTNGMGFEPYQIEHDFGRITINLQDFSSSSIFAEREFLLAKAALDHKVGTSQPAPPEKES